MESIIYIMYICNDNIGDTILTPKLLLLIITCALYASIDCLENYVYESIIAYKRQKINFSQEVKTRKMSYDILTTTHIFADN